MFLTGVELNRNLRIYGVLYLLSCSCVTLSYSPLLHTRTARARTHTRMYVCACTHTQTHTHTWPGMYTLQASTVVQRTQLGNMIDAKHVTRVNTEAAKNGGLRMHVTSNENASQQHRRLIIPPPSIRDQRSNKKQTVSQTQHANLSTRRQNCDQVLK